MGRLEKEVTLEYVTRLLRDKVKLKNKEKQEQAARTVTEDGDNLHKLFSKMVRYYITLRGGGGE